MSTIRFKSKLYKIGSWTIIKLPETASNKLPSRGMTMVYGTINNLHFESVLEPDGKGSHWFRVKESLSKAISAKEGDTVMMAINSTKEWPEPVVPDDLKKALLATPQAEALWKNITPMARWDWIRWIRATKQSDTRKRRIEVACSKLQAKNRRPCCFNRAQCTEPSVSNNGILMEPTLTSK